MHVQYHEPDELGNRITITIPAEDAVIRQKAIALANGYSYASDEDALIDFCIVHWADIIP